MDSNFRLIAIIAFFAIAGALLWFVTSGIDDPPPMEELAAAPPPPPVRVSKPEPEIDTADTAREMLPAFQRPAPAVKRGQLLAPTEKLEALAEKKRIDSNPVDLSGSPIRGRVVNNEDNPVPDILVQAVGAQQVVTSVTNAQGDFILGGLEEEVYLITTSTSDFTNASVEGVAPGSSGHVLRLDDLATIIGRVIAKESGVPVTRFEVAVMKRKPTTPRQFQAAPWTAFSDAEGAMEITGIQARQSLFIAARAEGFVPTVSEVAPIPPGENSFPLTLALSTGSKVQGQVLDPRGGVVAEASVFEENFVGRRFVLAKTDAKGLFSIDGLAGTQVTLYAQHKEFLPGIQTVTLRPGNMTQVTITLREGGRIQGIITYGDEPVGNVTVTAVIPEKQTASYHGLSGPDGRYEVTAVPPGEVTVTAHPSSRAGMAFSNFRTNAFVTEGQVTVVNILYPATSSTLEGLISQAGIIGEGRVVLDVETQAGRYRFNGRIEVDGTYRLEQLPAGSGTLNIYAKFGDSNYSRRTVKVEIAEGLVVERNIRFPKRRNRDR